MVMSRFDRQSRQLRLERHGLFSRATRKRKTLIKWLLIALAIFAILPPLYFHFKLRRFNQMRMRRCSWLKTPPLVCAHGGDSSKAFPNTVAAYHLALNSEVDCIELDVSRSSDGMLFALHDRRVGCNFPPSKRSLFPKKSPVYAYVFVDEYNSRDLQRISGNGTSRVGHFSHKEIESLEANRHLLSEFHDLNIPLAEDALKLISASVKRVILDIKVGPPLYEKGLAEDVLATVKRTGCKNCVVWAKSDKLARDIIKLSPNILVGYIVMIDPSTGTRTKLLRMRDAGVVGVYHPLVDEKLVKILHGSTKKVYAWTVDDEISMQNMMSEGVDAIVTNNPSLLQGLMQDIRRQCLVDGFHLST